MVNTFRRTIITTFICSQLVFIAAARDLSEYRVGDKVAEDITTPIALRVVDPMATEAFREKEAQRILVAFRFDTSAADLVEAEVRATFSLARSNFIRLMQDRFKQTLLKEDQMETTRFNNVIGAFKKENKGFPLSRMLAEDWALGSQGLAAQVTLLARIRQAMEQPIRYDNLTNALKLGGQVLLVPVKDIQDPITLEELGSRGVKTYRTNVLALGRAKNQLLEKFGPDEESAGRFAGRCLRVNCFIETELTTAARARRTEALFIADNYQAGQIVAKKDQLVDLRIMAAFNQIQENTATGRLLQQVSHEKSQVAQVRESNRLLIAGLIAAGALLLAVLAWFAFRRNAATPMLPAIAASNLLTDSRNQSEEWQQRALDAEEKVAHAHDAIRSGVMEQLKEKAMSSLVSQRSNMMEAQHIAAAEMAELERRLNELQSPLQDRLRTYESRIADLERALTAKGEENRELIKAKIALMRKQLEVERKGNDLRFN